MKSTRSHLTQTALAAILLCGGAIPVAAQTLDTGTLSALKPSQPTTYPAISLPTPLSGQALVTALGSNLNSLAAWFGNSPADFTAMLLRESSLFADQSGYLHYVCGALASPTPSSNGGLSLAIAPYPEDQTFLLHSRPGCKKVIYLDFKGRTTNGTKWNTAYTAGASIVTPPYDIDGNPSALSHAEIANIQFIWQRVAEDFAPFEVDVTTEDPGAEALQKTSELDLNYGKRVCIGGSSMDWLGKSAGGCAYVKSFDMSVDTPAFVFPAQLANGDFRYVGQAISHQVGHTFGLHHEGRVALVTNGVTEPAQECYQGRKEWAPIMGLGYYSNMVQWSKGEYAGANNTEDDIAIIANYVPFRTDNVGNTIGSAKPLTVNNGNNAHMSGAIESRTDVDVYSFATGAGNITLSILPPVASGCLYGQLTLYDGNGTPVATASPPSSSTGAVFLRTTVPQGNYYLAVDGVGYDDPLIKGFTDYGSVGQYILNANLVAPAAAIPPVASAKKSRNIKGAAPLTVNFSSEGSFDADGTITGYNWNFGDGTTASTAPSPSYTYRKPAKYTASLAVTDNTGLSSTDSVSVYVAAPNAIAVSGLALATIRDDGPYVVQATVTVKDMMGNPVKDAKVKGSWTGAIRVKDMEANCDKNGVCILKPFSSKVTGTFTFTVTEIRRGGYVYDPNMNSATEGSVTYP